MSNDNCYAQLATLHGKRYFMRICLEILAGAAAETLLLTATEYVW